MANEIDALLARVDDPALRRDLKTHFDRLRQKRQFGLVFEEHLPERVTLPQHPIRRGTKVVPRDDERAEPRVVAAVDAGLATMPTEDGSTEDVPTESLVAIADFGEPIYPGLTRLGSVDSGGGKPAHVVIKGENHHALDALQFTHAGQVDCIYIDPPYNTGARDWKYNNDYVDGDDAYRHSKWLAMMQRRLLLAKELLNPDDSVLIVTIDEKEYLRLGLLLEQVFPEAQVQMCSTLINPAGAQRSGAFGRNDEYLFFVMVGDASPQRLKLPREWVSGRGRTHTGNIRWDLLRRSGRNNAARHDRPALFYPLYIDPSVPTIAEIGEPLAEEEHEAEPREGLVALLPIRKDGSEGNWQASPQTLRKRLGQGRVRVTGSEEKGFTISVLKDGEYKKIVRGEFKVSGNRADGSIVVDDVETDEVFTVPSTQWRITGHDSTQYGTRLLNQFLPGREFPFPKSLYAVEDAIRFFLADKPNGVLLDFFVGSGTTVHALMRLNRQYGGTRRAIAVTNNEVSVRDASSLQNNGFRPGDTEWESQGIFENVTRPRIEAAITGLTPLGEPVKGDYKFTDEFPMADGFEENVEFVELTYLDAEDIELDMAFAGIAPLLWMRAGSQGPVIEERADADGEPLPYASTDGYAVLFDPDRWRQFLDELPDTVSTVFVVTDSASVFAGVAGELPDGLDLVRLYENYLTTFAINQGGQR